MKQSKRENPKSIAPANLFLESIVSKMLSFQRTSALRLQRITEHFSHRFKWVCLIAFIVVSGGTCLGIIVSNIFSNESTEIKVNSIQKPAYAVAEADAVMRGPRNLNQNLKAFKIFNDSLSKIRSPITFHSLLMIKHGILDTLNIYDTIFQKHQKEYYGKEHTSVWVSKKKEIFIAFACIGIAFYNNVVLGDRRRECQ